jgi:hypothetical protein
MARISVSSRPITDHDEIRSWAEERGASPACVRGTGDSDDVGILRLDFPGYTGQDKLQEISWDEWFPKFDDSGLVLLVQDETADGERSNFNKLVSRDTLESSEARSSRSSRNRKSASRNDSAEDECGAIFIAYAEDENGSDDLDNDVDLEEDIDLEDSRPVRLSGAGSSRTQKRQGGAKRGTATRSSRSSGSSRRTSSQGGRNRNDRSSRSRSATSKRGQATGGSRSSAKKTGARSSGRTTSARSSGKKASGRAGSSASRTSRGGSSGRKRAA